MLISDIAGLHQKLPIIKVNTRTGHAGLEEEKRYSSILSLTSVLDGVGG